MRSLRDKLLKEAAKANNNKTDISRALRAAKRVGLTVVRIKDTPSYDYDGERALFREHDLNGSDILHELGHFQVCSPRRRVMPEFGLGAGPRCPQRYAGRDARAHPDEEARASLLGILWERALGGEWEGTLEFHSWVNPHRGELIENVDTPDSMASILRWLFDHGFINKHGRPTKRLRTGADQ